MEERAGTMHGTGTLHTAGTRIHYKRWLPDVVRDVIVVAHGLGEHSGRYRNLVDRFVPKGFAVYAPDHRGHGLSSGIRGHVESFLQYRDDLASFIDRVREETGFEKVILVGHSMGGVIALSYSLLYPDRVSRLILSSPGLRPYKLPSRLKETLAKVLARIAPTLLLSNELDPSHVSRDGGVVQTYMDDPLVHDRVSPRFYVEFVKETDRLLREAPGLAVPLLLLQAGEDRLVHVGTNLKFFSAAGSPRKDLKVYEGLYHEVFNEPERDRVFADMEAWLGAAAQPAAGRPATGRRAVGGPARGNPPGSKKKPPGRARAESVVEKPGVKGKRKGTRPPVGKKAAGKKTRPS